MNEVRENEAARNEAEQFRRLAEESREVRLSWDGERLGRDD